MEFKMDHRNFNVADLDKSIAFYEEALGLHEVRRNEAADGSYKIVYMGNEVSNFQLASASSTWPSGWMTTPPLTRSTARWGASATATRPWGFILSMTRMGIGWK